MDDGVDDGRAPNIDFGRRSHGVGFFRDLSEVTHWR